MDLDDRSVVRRSDRFGTMMSFRIHKRMCIVYRVSCDIWSSAGRIDRWATSQSWVIISSGWIKWSRRERECSYTSTWGRSCVLVEEIGQEPLITTCCVTTIGHEMAWKVERLRSLLASTREVSRLWRSSIGSCCNVLKQVQQWFIPLCDCFCVIVGGRRTIWEIKGSRYLLDLTLDVLFSWRERWRERWYGAGKLDWSRTSGRGWWEGVLNLDRMLIPNPEMLDSTHDFIEFGLSVFANCIFHERFTDGVMVISVRIVVNLMSTLSKERLCTSAAEDWVSWASRHYVVLCGVFVVIWNLWNDIICDGKDRRLIWRDNIGSVLELWKMSGGS